ncbi:hypothetical protein CF70_011745 [Cupriavidus sp. SK-3]|nr:hypothetical protein CF70_011745 [Cupriavidus sp. SK-3]
MPLAVMLPPLVLSPALLTPLAFPPGTLPPVVVVARGNNDRLLFDHDRGRVIVGSGGIDGRSGEGYRDTDADTNAHMS